MKTYVIEFNVPDNASNDELEALRHDAGVIVACKHVGLLQKTEFNYINGGSVRLLEVMDVGVVLQGEGGADDPAFVEVEDLKTRASVNVGEWAREPKHDMRELRLRVIVK